MAAMRRGLHVRGLGLVCAILCLQALPALAVEQRSLLEGSPESQAWAELQPDLPPLPEVRRRDLIGKRVFGYLNWTRNRQTIHRRDVLDALLDRRVLSLLRRRDQARGHGVEVDVGAGRQQGEGDAGGERRRPGHWGVKLHAVYPG